MASLFRRIFVWLVSLGLIVAIFMLYKRMSEPVDVDFTGRGEYPEYIIDSNGQGSGGQTGAIGDVGVGPVRDLKYTDTSDDGSTKRIFGFKNLLYKQGDEWGITNPYMNVYKQDSSFHITADKGQVTVDGDGARVSPRDAKLEGNVVIRIVSRDPNRGAEVCIYLDDISFMSDRSLFSTQGPVRFVSQTGFMLGRGLDFVYNGGLERLEYLRLTDVESLRFKDSKKGLFAKDSAKTDDLANNVKPDDPAGNAENSDGVTAAGQKKGLYYKCILSTNVVIDTPEQVLSAGDELSINDIFWAKSSHDEKSKAVVPDSNAAPQVAESNEPSVDVHVTVAEQIAPDFFEEANDTVVKCDNGILVVPTDSNMSMETFAASQPQTGAGEETYIASLGDTEKTLLSAKTIGYSVLSGDTMVAGPLELVFYPNDVVVDANQTRDRMKVPVRVTATNQAQFLANENQVVLEGDCKCVMTRADANSDHLYTLTAPVLTVDLSSGKSLAGSGLDLEVKRITAHGGTVNLATVRSTETKSLGAAELKCSKFEYDTIQQTYVATGPGVIKIDNSGITEPNRAAGGHSLRKRCWALVRDFGTLKYYLQDNRIIADAAASKVLDIGYVPIIEGEPGDAVIATAERSEIFFEETADGDFELSSLSATGGITYENQGRDMTFTGSELLYDYTEAMVTVNGDETWPCMYNGMFVDAIRSDLETGEVSFQIMGPGSLPMGQ